ncbi:MAG: hypothetical protein B6241_07555 [Spirochaetaceae bacterium 4572_59]|nr:MAG: hypothetical protein B6241_07555 [Spirochaetaceae bacterium 4572_59]
MFVLFLYIFIFSTLFVLSEFLLGKIEIIEVVSTYWSFLSAVLIESILSAILTTLILYLILLQLDYEKIEKEKFILQQRINQSSKMNALGQLAGGIAHDFNNMLGGIMGAAQLLCLPKRNLDEKSLEYVDMIIEASNRASDLTQRLLALGRIKVIESSTINIHKVIADTVEILSKTIDKKTCIRVHTDATVSLREIVPPCKTV